MLKRTIGLGLLCMASHAYSANIVVNTLDDEDGVNNDKCSLREAIDLINRTDANGKIPTEGYAGCSGTDASPSIVLEAGKTYTLNKQVEIKKSLSINVLDDFANATKSSGENNAVIKAKGAHRLLFIDDQNPNIANLTVSMNQIDLVGCAAENPAAVCDTNGGLIFNRENLIITFGRLSYGVASVNGGAIYNEGVVNTSGTNATSAGQLALSNVYIFKNKAVQGGAIFSVQPRYEIANSVFAENEATDKSTGTIIYVERAGEVNSQGVGNKSGNITNSTIFGNKGRVLNLLDGMVVNSSTIIKNTAGVYLNSANGVANLSNSIVAENGTSDCIVSSSNKAVTNNVVYKVASDSNNDCKRIEDPTNPSQKLDANVVLLANAGINGKLEGQCDKPPKDGLLCPFSYEKKIFNGYFKPRLLATYTKLADSPLVNRGQIKSDGSFSSSLGCSGSDQRGVVRDRNLLCDIGAIELNIEDKGKIGQDIKFGETAKIELTDFLGDGELWPKQLCDQVFADLPNPPTAPKGGWQDGCLKFVEGKEATKGELFLDEDGLLKYKALRNYHGSDNFSLNVVTTTSRFSQAANDRSITLRGSIVQEPEDTFENKSVNVSGGSTGIGSLLGILGLVWLRRRLQGVK